MITVTWHDWDNTCERRGKLLQVGQCRYNGSDVQFAYVITPRMENDHAFDGKIGDQIILPVSLSKIKAQGVNVEIPLHD